MMEAGNLSEPELAFVLGNLTHAATDVFAHSYVNRYAGDVFELSNHEWASIRHINIESFVSNFIPPMQAQGSAVPTAPSDAVQRNGLNVPKDYLLRQFFLNGAAIEQFDRSGSAPHLVAVYDLHQSLVEMLAEGGKLEQMEVLGLQLVAQAQLGIPIAIEQLEDVQRIANRVNGELNNLTGDLADYAKDLNEELGAIEGLQVDIIQGGMLAALDITAELTKTQLELADATARLAELQNKLSGLPTKIAGEVCDSFAGWLGVKWICSIVEYTNPDYVITKRLLEEVRNLISDLRGKIPELQAKSKAVIREGLDVVQATIELRIALTNQFIDFALNKPIGSQFRNHLERWRDNLPIVMGEYAEANAQAIINSIDPSDPSILEPLTDWLLCYAPALSSVPVELSESICVVSEGVDQVKAEIEELENALVDLVPLLRPIVELKRELEATIEEIREELYGIAVTEGLKTFDEVADTNMLPFYKALTQPVGAGELNAVMSVDNSGQGLLLIPDAAERISVEMGLKNGTFDPEEFSPVHDAIVLSKLSLLDQAGLVRLAKSAGIGQTVFGPHLYEQGGASARNILYGFVQSIDGNHQWHDLSPPHPRVSGYDSIDFAERASNPDFGYGYPDRSCPRVLGMRMWVDAEARRTLFDQIFLGRTAYGVDAPHTLKPPFSPVLASGYPELVDGDWLKDSVSLLTTGTAKYDVVGATNERVAAVEIWVDGKLYGAVTPEEQDFIYSLDVEGNARPFQVTVIGRSTTGREISVLHFMVGCDGVVGQSGTLSTVEVVPGDSLWRISEMLTGDGSNYPELYSANSVTIDDPDLIYPGQILTLPWGLSIDVRPR